MNIESIRVSACRGAFDKSTYDVNLLHWLENIRPEIPFNDFAKKQLPAIMPHGLFDSRRQDSHRVHSGLVQIDIDSKHQRSNFDPDQALRNCENHKHIVAAGISCSGSGVYILIAVHDITRSNHHEKAEKVMQWVEDTLKVVPDAPVSNNLSSLRFASPYPPYINMDVTPIKFES